MVTFEFCCDEIEKEESVACLSCLIARMRTTAASLPNTQAIRGEPHPLVLGGAHPSKIKEGLTGLPLAFNPRRNRGVYHAATCLTGRRERSTVGFYASLWQIERALSQPRGLAPVQRPVTNPWIVSVITATAPHTLPSHTRI